MAWVNEDQADELKTGLTDWMWPENIKYTFRIHEETVCSLRQNILADIKPASIYTVTRKCVGTVQKGKVSAHWRHVVIMIDNDTQVPVK